MTLRTLGFVLRVICFTCSRNFPGRLFCDKRWNCFAVTRGHRASTFSYEMNDFWLFLSATCKLSSACLHRTFVSRYSSSVAQSLGIIFGISSKTTPCRNRFYSFTDFVKPIHDTYDETAQAPCIIPRYLLSRLWRTKDTRKLCLISHGRSCWHTMWLIKSTRHHLNRMK